MSLKNIREVAKRPKSKVLIENFLSLSVLQVLNYLLPLVTLPYLTKVIGLEMFGVLAIAQAIMIYFQTFVDFGFDYSSTRDIANNQKNIAEVSKIFWTVTFTKIVLIIISIIVLIPLLIFVPFFNKYSFIIILTFLYVPVRIFFPEWFFQGMERMKYITILNVLAKVLFTALIFVVIKEQDDYIYHPILTAGGYFVSGLFSLYLIFKHFKIEIYRPTFNDMKLAIKGSYDIFINLLMPNLYNSLSTLLLGLWWGNAQAGILDAGKKVIFLSDQAFNVLSRTFYPYLANNIKKHNFFFRISLLAGIAFTLVYIFGAGIIVRLLFSPEFSEARIIIIIMSISPVLFAFMNAFGTNYLILVHKEKILRNITLVSSLIGFIAAIFLVYYYKMIGASITLVFVWTLRSVLCYYYSQKVKKQIN